MTETVPETEHPPTPEPSSTPDPAVGKNVGTADAAGEHAGPAPEDSGAAQAPRRAPALDRVCAEAVDLARAAAVEVAGESAVGEHAGVDAEDDRAVTHRFATTELAYRGWHWSVSLARASRAKHPTVNEVVLLPGPDALQAPEWLPWSDRLRPGDLGVGDLLPTAADDPRLVPGFFSAEDDDDEELREEWQTMVSPAAQWELGLGRERVLSREGRDDTSERWYTGDSGPLAPIAEVAPAQCSTCGFFVALSGSMGTLFGVCSNEYAPDDARVVSADHGCGAHSEAAVVPATGTSELSVDEVGYDELNMERGEIGMTAASEPVVDVEDVLPAEGGEGPDGPAAEAAEVQPGGTAAGPDAHGSSLVGAEEPAEDLGHS